MTTTTNIKDILTESVMKTINKNGFIIQKCFGSETRRYFNYNGPIHIKITDKNLVFIGHDKKKYLYFQLYLMGCCDEKTSQSCLVYEGFCKFTKESFINVLEKHPLVDFDGGKIRRLYKSGSFWIKPEDSDSDSDSDIIEKKQCPDKDCYRKSAIHHKEFKHQR